MKVLLLLFAVFAACQGQGCVAPQVWEGKIFTYYQGSNDESLGIRRGQESYDAPNLRRRFFEEYDSSTERDYYDELYLHKEEIGYRVNLRTRECEKFTLREPFLPYEVPLNATLDYTFYLGSPQVSGNSVEMNYYSGDTERGYYRGTWTVRDCVPYIHSYLSSYPESHYHRTTFYDVTLGIANPDVFLPPEECQ